MYTEEQINDILWQVFEENKKDLEMEAENNDGSIDLNDHFLTNYEERDILVKLEGIEVELEDQAATNFEPGYQFCPSRMIATVFIDNAKVVEIIDADTDETLYEKPNK